MKKSLKLIISAVLLVALLFAYLAINKSGEDDTEGATDTTEKQYIALAEKGDKTASSFSYTAGDKTYTFVRTESGWMTPDDEKMPLDSTAVETIVQSVSTVMANRLIASSPEDVSEYGMDEPSYTCSITYSDGTSLSYKLGNKSLHSSEYYFSLENERAVYTVNLTLATFFNKSYNDLLLLDEIEDIAPETVTKIEVKTKDGLKTLTVSEVMGKVTAEDGTEVDGTVLEYKITNEAGVETVYEGEEGASILSGIINPTKTACVNYDCTGDALLEYNLGENTTMAVTVYYTIERESPTADGTGTVKIPTDYTYNINFGIVEETDGTDEGETVKTIVYMTFGESKMVFSVDLSSVSAFM